MPNKKPAKDRTIFVTVGTTLFEALIEAVTTDQALEWMVSKGYTELIVQYGKGRQPRIGVASNQLSLKVECYDFKPSLESDMQRADTIVSHAGAGTVMECLKLQKRLIVVINTALMHNHQTELAEAMGQRRHLYVVDSPEFLNDLQTWDAFERFEPIRKEPGDEFHFSMMLDSFLGFREKEL